MLDAAPPTTRDGPGRPEDLPMVAALHAEGLPHGFFARLGGRFLATYHRGYLDSPHGVMRVARRDGRVVGVVVGSTASRAHSRWVVRHLGLTLALWGLLGLLQRPRELWTFLHTRLGRYGRGIWRRLRSRPAPTPTPASGGQGARPRDVAVLQHVVVAPRARGAGLGTALVTAFVDVLRARGVRQVRLVTRADDGAGGLYERLGWRRVRERHAPDGSRLVEYALDLGSGAP